MVADVAQRRLDQSVDAQAVGGSAATVRRFAELAPKQQDQCLGHQSPHRAQIARTLPVTLAYHAHKEPVELRGRCGQRPKGAPLCQELGAQIEVAFRR